MCDITLEVDTNRIQLQDVIKFIDKEIHKFDITYVLNNNTILLHSSGIQAHSAHPELGKNAISPMIVFLNKLFKNFGINIKLFEFFDKFINTEFNGKSLGIDFEDESGKLTLNVRTFEVL